MRAGPCGVVTDYQELAAWIRGIAAPARLQLLRRLQVPHRLAEIRIEGPTGRPMARQTIRGHLQSLQDVGLVVAYPVQQGSATATMYRLEPTRLFVLLDTLNSLGLVAGGEETLVATPDHEDAVPAWPNGPGMVLVNGPQAGWMMPLSGPGPWLIGRGRGNEVHLPHDPFVSKQHAVINGRAGHRRIVPVSTTSPTTVNHMAVGSDGHRIRPGDLIQVGRSRLLYRD